MQVFRPISWGRAGKRFVGMPNSSCLRMEWVAENDRERSLIGTHPKMWCKNRSSTSYAIGVVLHRREKIYFIGKVSSTALKAQKPFSPSAIPNHPWNCVFGSEISKTYRARNIYIMRGKKSFTLYWKKWWRCLWNVRNRCTFATANREGRSSREFRWGLRPEREEFFERFT